MEEADSQEPSESEDGGASPEDENADASVEDGKDARKPVYYVTDIQQQGQYINMFKEQGMDAVILDHNIDASFITQLERRN